MTKTIVFVTGSMRRGGAERVISILANELVKRNWKVYIMTILYSKIGYDLDPRIEIIDISNEKMKQLIDTPRLIYTIRRKIKDIMPDVVVSFMLTINIVTWVATKGLKVKFIPSERNDPKEGRNKIKHWLSCFAYAQSYKTVFQTERAKEYYSTIIQNNSVVIPNPVMVEEFCKKEKKNKIVSVGRLTLQKNRKLLIDAFSDVFRKHSDFTLHIYGEGPLEAELRQQIHELNLDTVVYLHGNVLDVHKQIADSEIFVLSSDYEGLSNALIEAMMMGMACISTDCAGADEIIQNRENGIIVPVGNREELTKAMIFLIENDKIRDLFEEKAAQSVKAFTPEKIVDKWCEVMS